jgi:hypothetical protein
LPEQQTTYTALKMAQLTSAMDGNGGGGAKPMKAEIRGVNQKKLKSDTFLVVVPPNVKEGMQFVAQTPQGDKYLVTCPKNAGPNQQIRIQPPSSSKKENQPPHEQTKLFEIVAPEGVLPNQVLPVLVCGKRIPVTLPSNVVAGQKLKLKLPVEQVVGSIELSYDAKASSGWSRTIRMSDLKFQWVRGGGNDDDAQWRTSKSAFVRNLIVLQGNDARMRTGSIDLIPPYQAVVESELIHHNRTLVSYATVAHVQGRPLDEKTSWFQNICSDLTAPLESGRIKMNVRREHLLEDSIQAIMSLSRADMRKRWKLEFLGEPAIDLGGVMREWIQLVTEQIFNPDLGLWLSSVNNQVCMIINPASRKYQIGRIQYNSCSLFLF